MQNACMATLTIRNIPDEVHERLKAQAKRNRRSLNQEVIAELLERQDGEVAEREHFVNQMIAESQAVYAAVKKPMTTEEIRRSMEEGRAGMRRANVLVEAMRSKMKGFMTSEQIAAAIEEGRR